MTDTYSAKHIGVLEGLEAVRKRPAMYIGGKDATGAFRIVREIVDNCIDEHTAGHGNLVQIMYSTKTGIVTIADRGRGVPVDKHPKTGDSALTMCFTKLHAGGKFEGETYVKSGGLHGVGASCANALSDSFEVWSFRSPDPKHKPSWHYQKFSRGNIITAVIKSDPPGFWAAARQGTIVRMHPDPEIFGEHKPDPVRLYNECRDLAMLNPGLEIQIKIDDRAYKFRFDSGLVSMVDIEKQRDSALSAPFSMYEKGTLGLALCWYDDDAVEMKTYVNSMYTSNGGTHADGFREALVKSLREASGTSFESRYWLMGLRLGMNWRMQDPDYRSQTKEELSSDVTATVRDLIFPKLALWLRQNPGLVKKLVERASKFKSNEDRFKADNRAVKGLELGGKEEQALDPKKLIQCDPGIPAYMRELFLVEGESAGGTAIKAKYPHHEILKLRGVSINAQKQPSSKVLSNQEIRLLIKALGIKPGETDLDKMRVKYITILTDADHDGEHIASLLLAFFKVYYPEIVRQKRLRYINGPLFMGQRNGERVFGDTKEDVCAGFSGGEKGVRITRFKGWGEADPDQLEDIAFNPKTRRLVVLTMNDADEVRIGHIMGDDVGYRKELLFGAGSEEN